MILRFRYNEDLDDCFYEVTGYKNIRDKVLAIHHQLKKAWIEENDSPYEDGLNADTLMEYIAKHFPEITVKKVFLDTINFDE